MDELKAELSKVATRLAWSIYAATLREVADGIDKGEPVAAPRGRPLGSRGSRPYGALVGVMRKMASNGQVTNLSLAAAAGIPRAKAAMLLHCYMKRGELRRVAPGTYEAVPDAR